MPLELLAAVAAGAAAGGYVINYKKEKDAAFSQQIDNLINYRHAKETISNVQASLQTIDPLPAVDTTIDYKARAWKATEEFLRMDEKTMDDVAKINTIQRGHERAQKILGISKTPVVNFAGDIGDVGTSLMEAIAENPAYAEVIAGAPWNEVGELAESLSVPTFTSYPVNRTGKALTAPEATQLLRRNDGANERIINSLKNYVLDPTVDVGGTAGEAFRVSWTSPVNKNRKVSLPLLSPRDTYSLNNREFAPLHLWKGKWNQDLTPEAIARMTLQTEDFASTAEVAARELSSLYRQYGEAKDPGLRATLAEQITKAENYYTGAEYLEQGGVIRATSKEALSLGQEAMTQRYEFNPSAVIDKNIAEMTRYVPSSELVEQLVPHLQTRSQMLGFGSAEAFQKDIGDSGTRVQGGVTGQTLASRKANRANETLAVVNRSITYLDHEGLGDKASIFKAMVMDTGADQLSVKIAAAPSGILKPLSNALYRATNDPDFLLMGGLTGEELIGSNATSAYRTIEKNLSVSVNPTLGGYYGDFMKDFSTFMGQQQDATQWSNFAGDPSRAWGYFGTEEGYQMSQRYFQSAPDPWSVIPKGLVVGWNDSNEKQMVMFGDHDQVRFTSVTAGVEGNRLSFNYERRTPTTRFMGHKATISSQRVTNKAMQTISAGIAHLTNLFNEGIESGKWSDVDTFVGSSDFSREVTYLSSHNPTVLEKLRNKYAAITKGVGFISQEGMGKVHYQGLDDNLRDMLSSFREALLPLGADASPLDLQTRQALLKELQQEGINFVEGSLPQGTSVGTYLGAGRDINEGVAVTQRLQTRFQELTGNSVLDSSGQLKYLPVLASGQGQLTINEKIAKADVLQNIHQKYQIAKKVRPRAVIKKNLFGIFSQAVSGAASATTQGFGGRARLSSETVEALYGLGKFAGFDEKVSQQLIRDMVKRGLTSQGAEAREFINIIRGFNKGPLGDNDVMLTAQQLDALAVKKGYDPTMMGRRDFLEDLFRSTNRSELLDQIGGKGKNVFFNLAEALGISLPAGVDSPNIYIPRDVPGGSFFGLDQVADRVNSVDRLLLNLITNKESKTLPAAIAAASKNLTDLAPKVFKNILKKHKLTGSLWGDIHSSEPLLNVVFEGKAAKKGSSRIVKRQKELMKELQLLGMKIADDYELEQFLKHQVMFVHPETLSKLNEDFLGGMGKIFNRPIFGGLNRSPNLFGSNSAALLALPTSLLRVSRKLKNLVGKGSMALSDEVLGRLRADLDVDPGMFIGFSPAYGQSEKTMLLSQLKTGRSAAVESLWDNFRANPQKYQNLSRQINTIREFTGKMANKNNIDLSVKDPTTGEFRPLNYKQVFERMQKLMQGKTGLVGKSFNTLTPLGAAISTLEPDYEVATTAHNLLLGVHESIITSAQNNIPATMQKQLIDTLASVDATADDKMKLLQSMFSQIFGAPEWSNKMKTPLYQKAVQAIANVTNPDLRASRRALKASSFLINLGKAKNLEEIGSVINNITDGTSPVTSPIQHAVGSKGPEGMIAKSTATTTRAAESFWDQVKSLKYKKTIGAAAGLAALGIYGLLPREDKLDLSEDELLAAEIELNRQGGSKNMPQPSADFRSSNPARVGNNGYKIRARGLAQEPQQINDAISSVKTQYPNSGIRVNIQDYRRDLTARRVQEMANNGRDW